MAWDMSQMVLLNQLTVVLIQSLWVGCAAALKLISPQGCIMVLSS